jgi:hypothetical protein
LRWSKLQKSLQERLCDSLRGRVGYYITRYGPGDSYFMTRAWITLDQHEILHFSTVEWHIQHRNLMAQIEATASGDGTQDPEPTASHQFAHEKAAALLHEQRLYTRDDFLYAAEEYLNLSVEDALDSSNEIILALAMFDRRLGKRRLAALVQGEIRSPLVGRFHQIRCEAEGMAYGGNLRS